MNYSVVIPVYNSQDSLEELFGRIKTTFESFEPQASFEVVFVDDFSMDNSWKILKKLKKSNPDRVKIIRLAKNYGQHNATFCGFHYTLGDYIITIDDDLQYAPKDMVGLIQKIERENLGLVYGIGQKKHSKFRKLGSEFYKRGTKYFEKGLGEGSSFRVLTQSLVKKIITHHQHFLYIDELMYWYTDHIGFVEVPHYERAKGSSGYSIPGIYRLMKKTTLLYGTWPLKFMIWFGSVFSILSFLLGVFFIIKKLVFGIAVPGFTSLLVTILFSTSLILLCFGVLGNYLVNINIVLNKKPAYSIKEKRC